MAENLITAEYAQPDDPYAINVLFIRKTTAELTAMVAAGTIGIGTLYYDTTLGLFKLGSDPKTNPGFITQAGAANSVAITGGTINGTSIGASAQSTGKFSTLSVNYTDSTGTPGNVTNNSGNGRAAFAAAGTAVVVTNSSVAATDTVLVQLLGAADATLTSIVGVTVAAGSFTVTGNAAATAAKSFMFTVIKS